MKVLRAADKRGICQRQTFTCEVIHAQHANCAAGANRRRSCANVHPELRSPSGRRTLRPCAGTMVHPFSRRWASVRSRRRASISQAGQPVLVTEGDGNLLRPWHFAASLRTRPEDFYEVFTRIGSGKIPQSPFPNSTMRFRHSTPELTRLLPPPGPVKRI